MVALCTEQPLYELSDFSSIQTTDRHMMTVLEVGAIPVHASFHLFYMYMLAEDMHGSCNLGPI